MSLIIAEAGVNHNGDEALAFKLVDAAFAAGADIIKFQTYKAKNVASKTAQKADYQITESCDDESQLELLSRLELPYESHFKLVEYCNQLGIEFLSTAFDSESLNFLVDELDLKRLKIPSGEITNAPFILEHARTGCDLIISTGMATLAEIESVLGVIAFGYIMPADALPSIEAFQNAYLSQKGKASLRDKVTLLHCTTEYPAPLSDINLSAMTTISSAFGLPIGYSDHSEGIIVSIAAIAKGATVIEKHLTLDKDMEGPDHQASLDPNEFKSLVDAIKSVEFSLGDGIKGPSPSELKNKISARKSLIAANDISINQKISSQDIDIKRPGSGMSPYDYWKIQDKVAKRSYKKGDLIDE